MISLRLKASRNLILPVEIMCTGEKLPVRKKVKFEPWLSIGDFKIIYGLIWVFTVCYIWRPIFAWHLPYVVIAQHIVMKTGSYKITFSYHSCVLGPAPDKVHIFIFEMFISSPNPIFDPLLESSHWDDSNKWSNIRFGEEITQVELTEVIFSAFYLVLC